VASVEAPPTELYHADWSPDGRFIAFSHGCKKPNKMEPAHYIVGQEAPGWDICVVDVENPGTYVTITSDGLSNKEPDWVPVAGKTPK
jgi:Tol biopolymer transport system component